TSPGALAKPLPQVAHRDLLRIEDEQNWLPGILGVSLAGANQPGSLSQMDSRNGPLCASEAKESVNYFYKVRLRFMPGWRSPRLQRRSPLPILCPRPRCAVPNRDWWQSPG